jgi:DinB superfamily
MTATFSHVVSNPELTPEQIQRASRYLSLTRVAFVESTVGLSPLQWEFKPGTDRWSIAEIVEHVALIEDRVHAIIEKMKDAPEAASESDWIQIDDLILKEVPKRTRRVKAPESVCPTHRWSGAEALQHFTGSRQKTIQLVLGPSLRGHVVPHPVYGPWDGYQWLLAAGAHSARHTEQIVEVKSDTNFPQTWSYDPTAHLD